MKITVQEKIRALLKHSSLTMCLLGGLATGTILGVLFWLILYAAKPSVGSETVLFYTLALGVVSTLGGITEKLRSKHELTWPLTFLFFGLIFVLIVFNSLFSNPELKNSLFSSLRLNPASGVSWLLVILAVVTFIFSAMNPFESLWKFLFNRILLVINPVDYVQMYGEEAFANQIKKTTLEADRYKMRFSLLKFQVNDYTEMEQTNSKELKKTINELFYVLSTRIREYDHMSFIKKGQFLAIIAHGDESSSSGVGDRLRKLIESVTFMDKPIHCSYEVFMFGPGSDKGKFLSGLSSSLGVTIVPPSESLRRV